MRGRARSAPLTRPRFPPAKLTELRSRIGGALAKIGGWRRVSARALLGVAEPALAAQLGEGGSHPPTAQLLGDLGENEDFWSNVLRYVSYFFSVLLGTAYIAVKPLIELMKRPGTAILVVAGVGSLVWFVSFTVSAMLGMTEPLDYTASSIVTPM